ncbi:MAG: hypothetical protein ABIG61_15100 [Planctomycetota bacterium]
MQAKVWARLGKCRNLDGFYWRMPAIDWQYVDTIAYAIEEVFDIVFSENYVLEDCNAGEFWIDLKETDSGTYDTLYIAQFYLEKLKTYQADFDDSGQVYLADYAYLTERWGLTGMIPADLDANGFVGWADLRLFTQVWPDAEPWH